MRHKYSIFIGDTQSRTIISHIVMWRKSIPTLSSLFSQKLKHFLKRTLRGRKERSSQCIWNKLRTQRDEWENLPSDSRFRANSRITHIVGKLGSRAGLSAPSPASCVALSKSPWLSGPELSSFVQWIPELSVYTLMVWSKGAILELSRTFFAFLKMSNYMCVFIGHVIH